MSFSSFYVHPHLYMPLCSTFQRSHLYILFCVISHLSKQIKHLIKSHASQTKQIGCELGRIKNEVWREIQALKTVMTTTDENDNESIITQQQRRDNKMFEESHRLALSAPSSLVSSIYNDKSDASVFGEISTKINQIVD